MISYFTDPLLYAPTIGSMLMALSSAVIGVIAVIRKRSLVGEALAHATYPGVVIGGVLIALFPLSIDKWFSLSALIGAFVSAFAGLCLVDRLQKKGAVNCDAALCFVLSLFFGLGVLLASRVQFTHPLLYQQIQLFLYGQAATLDESHLVIYSLLSLAAIAFIFVFYRLIKGVYFDRLFSRSIGIDVSFIDVCSSMFLILAVVSGMRSVGIVLMSGMLIAPAVAARQWTNRLSRLFFLAGFFGMISAFFGVVFSLELPGWIGWKVSLPTGPMILLCAVAISLFSLLFSPKRGWISRLVRIARFRRKCRAENLLKMLYKEGSLRGHCDWLLLWRLRRGGWIERGKPTLTSEGKRWAARIIRLHRLWEVYLVEYLGQEADVVHRNAEEIEHIITPELEQELTDLLGDPKEDPHNQPIPGGSHV